MDRRAFLITTGWLSATAGAGWPNAARAAHAEHAATRGHVLTIVDSTLPLGVGFARYAAAMDLPTFDIRDAIGGDIGALWHTILAPLLTAQRSAGAAPWLLGVTRASDYFVLNELASRATRRLDPNRVQRITHGCISFAFAPR